MFYSSFSFLFYSSNTTSKQASTSSQSDISANTSLFGDEADDTTKSSPLWSSLSRRVAGGVLRQATLLEGEFFFDVRVYNVCDIRDVDPRVRIEKACAHLRMQVQPNDTNWDLIKQVFKNSKKKFVKQAVFYGDSKSK